MPELPKQLLAALEAEESGELARLLSRKRAVDFAALRSLLSLDPSVSSDFRRKAMYALGRWGDPSVVPEIRRLLPQLDAGERVSALSALGRLGTPEAETAIIEFADDPSPQVRKTAALALRRIGTPEASAKLRHLAASDPVSWIRQLAARHAR
jgi:HEAT repeat protein